jgi:hypothetical protein
MDDKDYRDPIQVPPISTASSPVIQVVRHIHDSTLAVLGEWGGQVKMLSDEINHFPFQACRLVGAHAREAANRDNGHQNRTLRRELLLYGINHAFVFPDLDGLSRQLQEELND